MEGGLTSTPIGRVSIEITGAEFNDGPSLPGKYQGGVRLGEE